MPAPATTAPLAPAIRAIAAKSTAGDPNEVVVPAPTDVGSLRAFLGDAGAPLVKILAVSAPLAADPSPSKASCERVAVQLRRFGSPGDLMTLAGRITDEPTREIAGNLIGALARVLGSCPEVGAEALQELAFDWSLWQRRVREATS